MLGFLRKWANRIQRLFCRCDDVLAFLKLLHYRHRRSDHPVRLRTAYAEWCRRRFVVPIAETMSDARPVGDMQQRVEARARIRESRHHALSRWKLCHQAGHFVFHSIECRAIQIKAGEEYGGY